MAFLTVHALVADACLLAIGYVWWCALTGRRDGIVGRFDLPPERPDVWARIHEHGRLRSVRALRWGNPGS
jgi:hypothetical protein